MRNIYFLTAIIIVSCISCSSGLQSKRDMDDFKFDKNGISRKVLENYLEKSITMVYFACPDADRGGYPYYEDDVRMIKNIGAKFLGRAIYRWGGESRLNEKEFLSNAEEIIKKMHE